MEKSIETFAAALNANKGPTFEILCDPNGKGCGKTSTDKTQRPDPLGE